jgi:hypothetical protein
VCGANTFRRSYECPQRVDLDGLTAPSQVRFTSHRFRIVVLRRSVPGADICSAAKFTLFDNLVSEREQLIWHCKAERLGGLEIDKKLKLGRLQHR